MRDGADSKFIIEGSAAGVFQSRSEWQARRHPGTEVVLALPGLQTGNGPADKLPTVIQGLDGVAGIDAAFKGQSQRQHIAYLKIINSLKRLEMSS